ncbi:MULTISPECIES: hypothetical protein [Yersinia]|nr:MULTISPECIES: hypothetical protein [Yersinia]
MDSQNRGAVQGTGFKRDSWFYHAKGVQVADANSIPSLRSP